MIIKAEAYTDDRAVEVRFDATLWFEQASDEEVMEAAACGWGGDDPVDAIAHFFEQVDSNMRDMFFYVAATQRTKRPVGFECNVNEEDAMAWIDQNSPTLAGTIREIQMAGSW